MSDLPTDALSPAGRSVVQGYGRLLRRRAMLLLFLAVLSLAAAMLDICVGPSGLTLGEAFQALLHPDAVARADAAIVWEIRLPQAVLALLVGAALALAGAEMQTVLNNPLASPFTLGVSSAASFGAAISIALGIGIPGVPAEWLLPANAFVFAFGSVLLLQALAHWRGATPDTLVLCGIALFFTFNALVALVQFLASQQALQQLVFWIMGSLARASWDKVQVLFVVAAAAVPFSLASSWALTALRLGEDRAQSLGIDVGRLRFFSLFRISLLTATAMAFVGTIGFVGLAGPHIARLAIGEDHRFFLPASMLAGAGIMSLASVASKAIVPGVLIPIGIVTALIGLPVFFSLIVRRQDLR